MNKKMLYTLWAVFFILCAGLGFIPEPAGFGKFCLVILSVIFFLPPAALLRQAREKGDAAAIQTVRNLAFASLVLTILLIIANFMTFAASEFLGDLLYILLCIVSAPMVCAQYWVLSLFGWACLMIWANSLLKE